ncbi:hypothetical protein K9N68_35320 (plasmid) [Kovacikia minuta CCNUW1]|uniref:hypothetical protein n=1 Tax=Kovacikia minuta TaxID=2931930 RepID=UPI001CC9FB9D|nr:hypothetical protein [Kovacikia minuta]UBF30463.1 hypothetical protein K9N68_35320 [Kovacikia minuta CCNUW1]
MQKALPLLPIVNLSSAISSGEIVAFNVCSDEVIYIVLALKPLDYRTEGFAKTTPDTSQSYRILGFQEDRLILDTNIAEEKFNIHDIQPLPTKELLLVCARSHYKSLNDFEKNGRIYSSDGEFSREILLGDGIQSVQVTSDGIIWTSFFDEGVFGNFGWKEPVGSSGLVAWDSLGNKIYDFQPTYGLGTICDCYALNVASDKDVWLYYYTEFPLVHLHHQKIQSVWSMPISGSDSFAVSGNRVLFRGGYDEQDTYHLFSLKNNGKVNLLKKLQFADQAGQKIIAERVVGRGSSLYILSNRLVYRINVPMIESSLSL